LLALFASLIMVSIPGFIFASSLALIEIALRRLPLSQRQPPDAAIVPGAGRTGVEVDNPAVITERMVEFFLRLPDDPDVAEGRGQPRVDTQRAVFPYGGFDGSKYGMLAEASFPFIRLRRLCPRACQALEAAENAA
jgi:hypothetical protein